MSINSAGTIVSAVERQRESWANPERGDASWFTLFSSGLTPTTAMSAGVMEIPPNGGFLKPHRHQQAEIYFVHEGTGSLTVNGIATTITVGTAAFIPGDAEHSVRNESAATLKILNPNPIPLSNGIWLADEKSDRNRPTWAVTNSLMLLFCSAQPHRPKPG